MKGKLTLARIVAMLGMAIWLGLGLLSHEDEFRYLYYFFGLQLLWGFH